MRRWWPLALCLLMAACDPARPVTGAAADGATTDAITTTALDARSDAGPVTDAAVPDVAPGPPADLDVPIAAIAALPGPAALDGDLAEPPAPAGGAGSATTSETEPPPPVTEPAPAPSAAEAACTARGGAYSSTPDGGVKACVRRTGDGGKQCRKATDCQGECLARSRTCAPIDPLLGCNEILQNDGSRVTLCLD